MRKDSSSHATQMAEARASSRAAETGWPRLQLPRRFVAQLLQPLLLCRAEQCGAAGKQKNGTESQREMQRGTNGGDTHPACSREEDNDGDGISSEDGRVGSGASGIGKDSSSGEGLSSALPSASSRGEKQVRAAQLSDDEDEKLKAVDGRESGERHAPSIPGGQRDSRDSASHCPLSSCCRPAEDDGDAEEEANAAAAVLSLRCLLQAAQRQTPWQAGQLHTARSAAGIRQAASSP